MIDEINNIEIVKSCKYFFKNVLKKILIFLRIKATNESAKPCPIFLWQIFCSNVLESTNICFEWVPTTLKVILERAHVTFKKVQLCAVRT